jgi:adenine phosphoribosyltransferase
MDFYTLKIGKIKRKLPIIPIAPKLKVASINLLGDRILVEALARSLGKKIKDLDFDFLVGPEVKVVPLLQELSRILKKERYIVCRKEIHGYMRNPLRINSRFGLVLDGEDAKALKGKRVVIVDDVVSSGYTISKVLGLMEKSSCRVVAIAAAFKQGEKIASQIPELIYIYKLPVFTP